MTIRNLDDLAIAGGTKVRNVATGVLAFATAGGILLCTKLSNNTPQMRPDDAGIISRAASDAGIAAPDATKDLALTLKDLSGRVQVALPTTGSFCDLVTHTCIQVTR